MALLKTSNPAFRSSVYSNVSRAAYGEAMTVNGTIHRTGILLLLLLSTAFVTWSMYFKAADADEAQGMGAAALIVGLVGGLVFGLITSFKMTWAPITAPLYALFEGLLLGGISASLEAAYPGIAISSVVLTFGTCFVMLACYRSGLLRPTQKFAMGVVAATGGICMIYLLSMVLGLFHVAVPGIFGGGPIGIIFSLVVVTIAALNLILDFGFIEQGASMGAPKYMEWYGAFGLVVTLVWLYLEILRLLSKLRSRR